MTKIIVDFTITDRRNVNYHLDTQDIVRSIKLKSAVNHPSRLFTSWSLEGYQQE